MPTIDEIMKGLENYINDQITLKLTAQAVDIGKIR